MDGQSFQMGHELFKKEKKKEIYSFLSCDRFDIEWASKLKGNTGHQTKQMGLDFWNSDPSLLTKSLDKGRILFHTSNIFFSNFDRLDDDLTA